MKYNKLRQKNVLLGQLTDQNIKVMQLIILMSHFIYELINSILIYKFMLLSHSNYSISKSIQG